MEYRQKGCSERPQDHDLLKKYQVKYQKNQLCYAKIEILSRINHDFKQKDLRFHIHDFKQITRTSVYVAFETAIFNHRRKFHVFLKIFGLYLPQKFSPIFEEVVGLFTGLRGLPSKTLRLFMTECCPMNLLVFGTQLTCPISKQVGSSLSCFSRCTEIE